jgi:DNA-binding response OmpR family regulator
MAKRILVIDDEEVVRDAFSLTLAQAGYEVELAASGEEGVRLFSDRRPDLVFLDLRMPGIDGVETLRRLRALDPGAVPITIVTAFHTQFLRALDQAAGQGLAFTIMAKPLAAEQILAAARTALDGPKVA